MRDVALGKLLAAWAREGPTDSGNTFNVEIYEGGVRIDGRPPVSQSFVHSLLVNRVVELNTPDSSDTDEPAPTPVRAPSDPLLNVAETLLAVRDDVRELLKRVPPIHIDGGAPHLLRRGGVVFLVAHLPTMGRVCYALYVDGPEVDDRAMLTVELAEALGVTYRIED